MKRHIVLSLVGAVALGGAGFVTAKALPTSATSPAFSGHRFAAKAKISLANAQRIALKAQPGTITDEELEKESGGTGLRYSFDVKGADGVTYEVGVDARTGQVLEDSREGAHPD